MASELSIAYQNLKPVILEILSLSRDAIHIHVGFITLVLTILLTRKKLNQWSILIPCFLLSMMMEFMDIWHDTMNLGKNSLSASIHDIINTNFIPFILVLLARNRRGFFDIIGKKD